MSFAHMILSVHAHDDLIPWTAARTGSGDSWRVGSHKDVPRLGCWYPDCIPLGLIAAAYIVTAPALPLVRQRCYLIRRQLRCGAEVGRNGLDSARNDRWLWDLSNAAHSSWKMLPPMTASNE